MSESLYLDRFLAPFAHFLKRDDVTDLFVNQPQELWVETLGGSIERHEVSNLDAAMLARLARQIAAFSSQGINREHPILSASLPDGARVQIVLPPATRGQIAIAVRRHAAANLGLDDYTNAGAFEAIEQRALTDVSTKELQRLLAKGDFSHLLRTAVQQRRNILVSGGTSTGKTTFLSTLIAEIDPNERLILIEDTPELAVKHKNTVGLIAARSALGEAVVTMEDLLNASLRLRPDRIILGELRGPEAFSFLRAINTGHPGSMTTVHADSPARAIEQIVLLILQSGTRLDRESITHYVRSSIDVYVQLVRVGGRRQVEAIEVRS